MRKKLHYSLENPLDMDSSIRLEKKLNAIKGVRAFVNGAAAEVNLSIPKQSDMEVGLEQIIDDEAMLKCFHDHDLFDPQYQFWQIYDVATIPDLDLEFFVSRMGGLLKRSKLPSYKVVESLAKQNKIKLSHVKGLEWEEQAISGKIQGKRVSCGTGEYFHLPRATFSQPKLYFACEDNVLGYIEFTADKRI